MNEHRYGRRSSRKIVSPYSIEYDFMRHVFFFCPLLHLVSLVHCYHQINWRRDTFLSVHSGQYLIINNGFYWRLWTIFQMVAFLGFRIHLKFWNQGKISGKNVMLIFGCNKLQALALIKFCWNKNVNSNMHCWVHLILDLRKSDGRNSSKSWHHSCHKIS